jgi:hypothetical protein
MQHEIPPYPYLFQVAEHCPRAALTYLSIWKEKDKKNSLSVYKEDIRLQFLMSPTRFRNDLLLLVREGLVSVNETPLSIDVDVIGYDDRFDEFGNQLED